MLLQHNDGSVEDITIPGSYFTDPPDTFTCPNCTPDFPLYVGPPGEITSAKVGDDPGVSGEDNSFSTALVISPAAPEPVTLLLFGLGLGGVAYRRRLRK